MVNIPQMAVGSSYSDTIHSHPTTHVMSGITDKAMTFKKPFQTVIRPPTMNHNIHNDYIKHPPEVRNCDIVHVRSYI